MAQRNAQTESGIRMEARIVQIHYLIAFPPHQQGFPAPALERPCPQQRIQMFGRIDTKKDGAERLSAGSCLQRKVQTQMHGVRRPACLQIVEEDPVGAQHFTGDLPQMDGVRDTGACR